MDRDSILRAAAEAADQLDENYVPAPGIVPQPVPTAIHLSSSNINNGIDENNFVIITLTTPVGQNTYFLDPESADKLAAGIQTITEKMI